MKLLSWNVNGIRAITKKGFSKFLKKEKAEVLCLQEVKISQVARESCEFDFPGYNEYWNSAQRPGYSGTAVLVRSDIKQPKATNGFGVKKFDIEGRVQTLEFDKFYLINVYFPNSAHGLVRIDYKLEFNKELLKYVKKLDKKKSVVITGDFNVAHEEIDLARPKDNKKNPGFTDEERGWMTKFLKAGFVDTFRALNSNKVQYSWWSYRFNARAKGIGWRIDYFCVSCKMLKNIKKSYILDKVMGSDHCPVGIDIK